MLHITTCQTLPVTQCGVFRGAHLLPTQMTATLEHSCLFKDQDTSTPLLWQDCRTRSGLSGNYLSTRSQGFITLSSLSQTTHPHHLQITTAGQCIRAAVYRWEWACWSLLLLFTPSDSPFHFTQVVLSVALCSWATLGLLLASTTLANWGMFIEWNPTKLRAALLCLLNSGDLLTDTSFCQFNTLIIVFLAVLVSWL